MKKRFAALLLAVCMLMTCMPASAFTLPSVLTEIEDEAFRGDGSLNGVVTLPDGVTRVGDNAFTGTGLYALIVPEGTAYVGPQAMAQAAYVRVNGAATQVGALSGVKCVLAPEGSSALTAAEAAGADAVPLAQLVAEGGFLYHAQDGAVTLLCAADVASVGASVEIPAEVDGLPVTAISGYAFIGCTGLEAITLPIAVKPTVTTDATADCPAAVITYAGEQIEPEEVIVNSVTANVTAGASGNSITWSVDAQVGEGGSYAYTVERNGSAVLTTESDEATFVYEAEDAGAYRLLVTVTSCGGVSATGVSAVLYIAVEALELTVPETLQTGENLPITIGEAANAQGYTLYVTDEATGALVVKRTLTAAQDVTVDGYLLPAGEYRVSGYVHGNDYRYTVPTVRNVTVSGALAAGPAVPAQEPMLVNSYRAVTLAENNPFVIRYQLRCADGTLTEPVTLPSAAKGSPAVHTAYIYAYETAYQSGGVILVQAAMYADGLWTDWGAVTEVALNTMPALTAPTVTCPETVRAGADFTVAFTEVENATWYNLDFVNDETGESWNYNGYSKCQSLYISGASFVLPAGSYTVRVEVSADGYTGAEGTAKLTITGTRPAAPDVAVDIDVFYLNENLMTITVTATGYESACVGSDACVQPALHRFNTEQISLTNGVGSRTWNVGLGEFADGWYYAGYAFVYADGVWSDPGVVYIPIRKPEPLAEAVITAPETLSTGADLTFSFAAVEGAESYDAYLRSTAGTDGSYIRWFPGVQPEMVLTHEGYDLPSGSYYVEVKASSASRGASSSKHYFTVTGTRPAAPAVACDADEVWVGATAAFTIEGADGVPVHVSWSSSDGGSGTYTGVGPAWQYTFPSSRSGDTMTFRFSVKQDGLWSQWAVAEMIVLAEKPMDKPVIACPETAQAGAEVVFTFAAVENADSYSVTLLRPDGTTRSFTGYPDNEMTLPGYDLNPGVYTLRITASGASCDSSTAECTFTVTGTRSAAPAALVDKTTVFTGESYTFAIDGGDCDLIAWRYTTDAGGSNSGTLNVLTDVTVWETSASWVGVQSYSFCCLSDGLWSAWSEPITVTISQRPAMPEPVVTLPDAARKGTDLTVAFAGVEGADYYYVYLYTIYGQQIASRYLTEAGSVTFAGCILPDSYVRVQVSARSTEGGRSTSTATLRVLDAALPAAPAVIGPVDGLVQTETRAVFTVATPGADQAAVRRYRVGDPNNVTVTTFAVTGDETGWSEYRYDTGSTWAYAFSVQKDGVWSAWSSELRVAVVEQLPLAAPVITCAESFLAGEDITFSYTPVDGAAGYWWTLQRDGAMLDNNNDGVNPTALAATIPGWYEYLSAGAYRLKVTAYTDDGETSQSEHAFTITGTRPAAPAVTCDANAWVGGSASFTIEAEGAEATRSGLKQADGTLMLLSESTEWAYSFTEAEAGETLTFCFFTKVDGLWTAWAEVSLTVLAEQPLAAPEVTAPASLRCGEDLEYLFNAVQGAVSYTVTLRRPDGTIDPLRDTDKEPGNWYSVTGFKMGVGEYTLIVTAIAEDGRTSATEKTFTVSGTMPAAPTVTVDKQVIAVGECPTFTIDTTGAEAFYMDAHGAGLGTGPYWVLDDEMQWTTPYSPASGTTIGFRVKIDGVWSLMSEPIVITVTDAMPAPALTLPESVEQGIDITITIGAVTGAKGYDILVLDPAGLRGWSEYLSAPGSTTLYGCILEPGVHTVQAYAYDANYRPGESASAVFTVTAPTGTRPDAPAVTASVTEAGKGDDVAFTIDAAGADMMVVRYSSYTGSPRVIDSSAGTIAWTESFYAADQETYSFAVRVNGVWSSYSEPITVRSAADDSLSGPLVSLPDTHAEGQDLYVHFTKVENATRYRAFLHDPSGAWVCDQTVFSDDSAVFSFPGYYFITPGRYSIRVRSEGSDVSSDFIRTYFTVVSGDRPAAPAVTADAEYSLVNAKHGFTIDTAGAERAAVRYILSNDQASVNVQELTVTGDSLYWTNQLYDSSAGMTVKYLFSVCVDGVWSPWSAAKTVRIVDELPKGAPVITCAESFLAGEDITFSVEAPADAVSCSWLIDAAGSRFAGGLTASGDATLSALDHRLPAQTEGLLTVYATFEDGETTQAEHTFAITGERQSAPALSAGAEQITTDEQVTLTVTAPGASQVCICEIDTGSYTFLTPVDGVAGWDFSTVEQGEYSFRAAACYGTQWTLWSDPVIVTVTDDLPAPCVTFPEAATEACDLTLTIESNSDADCFVATVYTAESEEFVCRRTLNAAAGDLVIPGCYISGGVAYQISVKASNAGGKTSYAGTQLTAAACDQARPAAPNVTCSSTGASAGDTLTLTVDTAGADAVWADLCTSWGGSYDPLSGDAPEYTYTVGEHEECLLFRFSVQVDGVWSAWTEVDVERLFE